MGVIRGKMRRRGQLLSVLLLASTGSVAAFSGLSIPRLRTGPVYRRSLPLFPLCSAEDNLATGKTSTNGGKLLEFLEFVIGTTFQSPLYVGDPELHMALPLPAKDSYPEWFPKPLRLPGGAYDLAERGVEEGWIKRAPADQVF